jgi:hypothetical protein
MSGEANCRAGRLSYLPVIPEPAFDKGLEVPDVQRRQEIKLLTDERARISGKYQVIVP